MRYFLVKYVKKQNGAYDEVIRLEKQIRDKELFESNVILDFKDRKVLKLRMDSEVKEQLPKDWDRVRGHYRQNYKDIIDKIEAGYAKLEELDKAVQELKEDVKEVD